MEALVRGLIEELLDLKAVASTIDWRTGERSGNGLGTVVQAAPFPAPAGSPESRSDGSAVALPRREPRQDVPSEPAMARIMQSDGTMKMEPRYGEKSPIDSSRGYGRNGKDTSARSRQNPLIYAAEDDKPDRAKV